MRIRRRSAALAVLALALGLSSCPDTEDEVKAESTAAPPVVVRVGVDGCATRRADGTCVRPPAGLPTMCEGTRGRAAVEAGASMALVIWADAPGTLAIDGQPVDATPETIDGGARWHLDVPASARAVELRCTPGGSPCWSMTLGTPQPEPDSLSHARALRAVPTEGDGLVRRRDALAALEAGLAEHAPQARRAALDVITDLRLQGARVESDPERRRAAYREALEWTTRAFDAAQEHGEVGRASCHARRALRYSLRDLGEPQRAQRWRRRLDGLGDLPPSVAAKNDYYAGVLFQNEGDLQAARAAYLRAERGARRYDHEARLRASTTMAATVLAGLGRETDVEALFERARSDRERLACLQWLLMLNNHSYSRYQLSALGRPAADPVPDLDEVLTLVGLEDGRDSCWSAELQEHARLNLGLVAIERGWTGEASRLLEQVEEGEPAPDSRFWVELLRQRIVLADAQRGALVELAMRDEPPRPGTPPEQHWLRQLGRGQAFESLGIHRDAIEAYRQAERSLDTMMGALDFEATHERLLRGRQSSAGRLVALLVSEGRAEEALCVARRARRRTHDALDRPARISALSPEERVLWREALAQVQQQRRDVDALAEQAWSLAADELAAHAERLAAVQARVEDAAGRAQAILYGSWDAVPDDDPSCEGWRAPGPGEVSLLYFPVDRDEHRWQGFAFDAGGVRATALLDPPLDPDAPRSEWSEALLAPFHEALEGASGVRVLPTGRLWTVPFAALPWKDDLLVARASVVISLDLAQRAPTPEGSGVALVVGDPRGDLPAARREAVQVATALDGHGWTVDSLTGQQVRASELRERLPQADLLHYAGHAEHGGTDGWGSTLRLSGDGRLEVRDVMALPRVPPVVMLPACDTASIAPGTLGGGMSIARAFLLAGADLVVASQDLLDDRLGQRLAAALYEQGPVGVDDGPAALRRALLEVRSEFPPDTWQPVVALVP